MKIDVIKGNLLKDCVLEWDVVKDVHCLIIERPRDQRLWETEGSPYNLVMPIISKKLCDGWYESKGTCHAVSRTRLRQLGLISRHKYIKPTFIQPQIGHIDSRKYATPLVAMSNLWLSEEAKATKPSNTRHIMTYKAVKRYWKNIDDINADVYSVGYPFVLATQLDSRNENGQLEALEEVFGGMNTHIILFNDPEDEAHSCKMYPPHSSPKVRRKKFKKAQKAFDKHFWWRDRWSGYKGQNLSNKRVDVKYGLRPKGVTKKTKEEVAIIRDKWKWYDVHRYAKSLQAMIKANKSNTNKTEESIKSTVDKITVKLEDWLKEIQALGHDPVFDKNECAKCRQEKNDD